MLAHWFLLDSNSYALLYHHHLIHLKDHLGIQMTQVQLPNLDISLLVSLRWQFLHTSFLSPPNPLEDPSPLVTEELEETNVTSQNGTATFVSWTHFFVACWVETHADSAAFCHVSAFFFDDCFFVSTFVGSSINFPSPASLAACIKRSLFWAMFSCFVCSYSNIPLLGLFSMLSTSLPSSSISFLPSSSVTPLLLSSSRAFAARSSGADIWKISREIF